MSESITFETTSDDSHDESNSHSDAIAAVVATSLAMAAAAVVGVMVRKHFEDKAEQELWTEATQDLDLR